MNKQHESDIGLVLYSSQIKILKSGWNCPIPNQLTSYKKEAKYMKTK